jgi:hypothetical protein
LILSSVFKRSALTELLADGIYLGETTPGRDSTPLPDTVHRARQGNPNSDERHAAQQVLDGLTDDVLAISRRNGFDAKKEIQIAVIL